MGILLASWYLARRVRSALTYRRWERKVAERGDRARANVRKYEDKYPKVGIEELLQHIIDTR